MAALVYPAPHHVRDYLVRMTLRWVLEDPHLPSSPSLLTSTTFLHQTPNDKRGSSGDPPQDSGCGGGSDPRTICLPPTRKGYAHVLEFHVGPGLYQFAIKDPNGRIWRAEKNGIPIPGLPPITVREGLGGFMLMNNVPDDEEDEDDEPDAIVGAVAHASNGNGHAAAERERNSAGPGSSRSGGETERSSVAAEEESSAIAAPQQQPAPTPFSRGKFENRPQKKRRSLSTTDGSSAVRSTFGGGGAVSLPDRRQSSTRSGRLVTAPVLAESVRAAFFSPFFLPRSLT